MPLSDDGSMPDLASVSAYSSYSEDGLGGECIRPRWQPVTNLKVWQWLQTFADESKTISQADIDNALRMLKEAELLADSESETYNINKKQRSVV